MYVTSLCSTEESSFYHYSLTSISYHCAVKTLITLEQHLKTLYIFFPETPFHRIPALYEQKIVIENFF